MAAALLPPFLPRALLETLLYRAPLDVLLFDTRLICRYAAPADDTLVGRTAAELVGASAEEIFGRAGSDLLAALHLAADAATAAQYPAYRYTRDDAESRTYHCWSVAIEPVLLHDYRGSEEFRGVLVTLADIEDLADERDRMRQAEGRLTAENTDLRLQLETRRRRAAAAQEHVRTLLAPVSGYLQLLARRPELLVGQDQAALIAQLLPRLAAIAAAVDEAADSVV